MSNSFHNSEGAHVILAYLLIFAPVGWNVVARVQTQVNLIANIERFWDVPTVIMVLYNDIGEALANLSIIPASKALAENLLHEVPGPPQVHSVH